MTEVEKEISLLRFQLKIADAKQETIITALCNILSNQTGKTVEHFSNQMHDDLSLKLKALAEEYGISDFSSQD